MKELDNLERKIGSAGMILFYFTITLTWGFGAWWIWLVFIH